MINSLYIAETGLNAQKIFVDVISNNIANTSTAGFKKSRVNFIDLVVDSNTSTPVNGNKNDHVYGVHFASIDQDFSQGSLKLTGHPFDLAIQGEGFLEISLNQQEVGYTRIGRLRINAEGDLVTLNGHKLTANIIIPPDVTNLIVEANGMVKGLLSGEEKFIELGQIELTRFTNPSGLFGGSEGIYRANDASGEKTAGIAGENGLGKIQQGYTEESNVSMVEEMVNLVVAQRGYQLNARVIQISDQLLETINNLRR